MKILRLGNVLIDFCTLELNQLILPHEYVTFLVSMFITVGNSEKGLENNFRVKK